MTKLYIVFSFIAFSTAYVIPEGYYEPQDYPADVYESERFARALPARLIFDEDIADEAEIEEPQYYIRERRSLQPGAPNFPMPGSQLPTSITSNIEKHGPNTAATINAQHKTDKYDVGATWSKVIRGPGRSKPNWSVGGTYRW